MSGNDDKTPLSWKHVILFLGIVLIMAGCEVTRYITGASMW